MGCILSNNGVLPKDSEKQIETTSIMPKTTSSTSIINSNNVNLIDEVSVYHQKGVTYQSMYKKGKELGKGGYSTVYEVINKQTNRRYASKEIIKAKLKPDDEIGLKQEIEIMKNLNHKNIVKFIDFFDDNEHYYVVLELLEGGMLMCYNDILLTYICIL